MTFIHYDKLGNRTEYSDLPQNEVIVKLKEPYYTFLTQYQIGDEIVIPIEVAKRINCEIYNKHIKT